MILVKSYVLLPSIGHCISLGYVQILIDCFLIYEIRALMYFLQLPTLLLRSLLSGFHIPNQIRLAVFGSMYLKDTERPPKLLVGC
jgi:hypothetical protein